MSNLSETRKAEIYPYIGMLLGVLLGIKFNDIGLWMLIGYTVGLLYDRFRKNKKNSL